MEHIITDTSLQKGKMPPHAVDLEEVIIGAMIIDRFIVSEVISYFRKENVFYKAAHQEIYNTIVEMFEANDDIDLLTISSALRKRKKLADIGGELYLIQLSQKVSSSAHTEFHCRIVMQQFVKRSTIRVGSSLIEASYDESTDIFDHLAGAQQKIDSVADWLTKKKASDMPTIVDNFFEEKDNKTGGVPSGLYKLQSKMNGYRDTDLIIVAARPGMGKTAFMLSEAKSMAKKGIPVGIFSLEMSDKQIVGRMYSDECEIDATKISRGTCDDFEIRLMKERSNVIRSLPIFINDQPGISTMELKIQASKWKREHGIKMIFIDYLQLMTASHKNRNGNREQEISSISGALKGIAKELEIPVMALSQLSRSVEQRGGMKRPILSDLRESGAIEQDADVVMFLLRPEYYKIDIWDDDERTPTAGQVEIGVAKFRGGETGATVVGSKLRYMRFHDLEDPFFAKVRENSVLPPPKPVTPTEAFDLPTAPWEADDEDLPDNDDVPF